MAARAEAVGYKWEKTPNEPFTGYYFHIRRSQEALAPSGAKNYVVNGDISGGFGLIAFPTKYGYSGVKTFVVNQDGVAYQKDLGKDTQQIASEIKTYNPDKT